MCVKIREGNKQVTFKEARLIMKKNFEDKPVLKELYIEYVARIISGGEIFLNKTYVDSMNVAEKIIEKIFFEER